MIAICAEHGRFATSTYSCECASPGGTIYLAIFNHQIYRSCADLAEIPVDGRVGAGKLSGHKGNCAFELKQPLII